MGIVDIAATTCLSLSGAALAAPYLESKVPALGTVLRSFTHYKKFVGIFGIVGGALGLILIPAFVLFAVGFAGVFANFLLLIVIGLELIGCAGSIVVGGLVVKGAGSEEAASGQLDGKTLLGLGAVGYGLFLMLVLSVLTALN